MDPKLDKRIDDLEEAFGALLADLALNLRDLKGRIEALQKLIEGKDALIERTFDLEDDRYKLVMDELTRISQDVAQLQRHSWHESDNLRSLSQLRRERGEPSSRSPVTTTAPPAPQQRVKLLAAITALLIALGTLATSISNACNQLDFGGSTSHKK